MNKKLTIMLDEEVIIQAKNYAATHKVSLSRLIEKYFRFLVSKNSTKKETSLIPPKIESLSGIISIPRDLDTKEEYKKYRAEKVVHE